MTLKQMRYLLAIAECRSITAAAQMFYISQASLSEALREVEREYGIKVFERSNRGVSPTPEGLELISMIRRVVQQDDLIAERFSKNPSQHAIQRLAVSSQRYSFVVEALAHLMAASPENAFAFALRETDTEAIFSDIRSMESDLGILCITSQNRDIVVREIDRAGLSFTVLVETVPNAVISETHPLASRKSVKTADLSPFPRILFEQRNGASAYYYEDPLPEAPRTGVVMVRDRGSMVSLINMSEAYAIGSGFSTQGMDKGTVSVPISTDERMQIGYLQNPRAAKREIVASLIAELEELAHDAKSTRRRPRSGA